MEQLSGSRQKELQEIEQKIGTSFLRKTLLNHALTHSSYGHEHKIPDNERLEFLGDAILKLVISEYIYHKFPERAEGDLTKIRAAVISDEA
ncbi:MAG: ribonuclease III domain-containing protein, partial [bacterium]